MAMWHQNIYIVVPLVLIILGHWSLILQGAFSPIKARQILNYRIVLLRCPHECSLDQWHRLCDHKNQ